MRKILYLEPDEDWFLAIRKGTRMLLPGEWLIERAASVKSFTSLLALDAYDMAMLSWPEFGTDETRLRTEYMQLLRELLELRSRHMHVILLPESDALNLDPDAAEMISTGRIHVVPKSGFNEQLLLEKIYEISEMQSNSLLVGASDAHYQQITQLMNLRCDNLLSTQKPDFERFISACREQPYSGYILEYEMLGKDGSEQLVELLLHHMISPLLLIAYDEDVQLNRHLLGLIGHRQIDFLSSKHLDEQALFKLIHCMECPLIN